VALGQPDERKVLFGQGSEAGRSLARSRQGQVELAAPDQVDDPLADDRPTRAPLVAGVGPLVYQSGPHQSDSAWCMQLLCPRGCASNQA
jgi:hypothetical protein